MCLYAGIHRYPLVCSQGIRYGTSHGRGAQDVAAGKMKTVLKQQLVEGPFGRTASEAHSMLQASFRAPSIIPRSICK
jgi:hypothetical protein